MKATSCVLLLCMPFAIADAQRVPIHNTRPPGVTAPTPASSSRALPQPLVLKRPGHYTKADWRHLIDSTWGPGLSTALKLQTFDFFWNKVDQTWGAFPNLAVNWDSLRNVYRPQVAAGVSRGRFAGILSRLTRALCEWHVYVDDLGIDSTMGYYWLNGSEYPNLQSFHYQPGTPLLDLGASILRMHFGAGITSLGDSLALVYSVIPNHPLGLQPGDIILGYDGIPWRQLVTELFDAELPALGGGFLGSTPAAVNHCLMWFAGMNWGLFDTIDILKYPANDTVHLPTSLLKSITPPYLVATEQLPVHGVAFPTLETNNLVSWGVVEGTSTGYVYVWDWYGVPEGNTRTQFAQAIADLKYVHNVNGLILDFRTNLGGWWHHANEGLKLLFNSCPMQNYSRAMRVAGSDHFQFAFQPGLPLDSFAPTSEIFDHPIGVLTGPLCGSAGDMNSFKMRFHPMARFFGKSTAGAYTYASEQSVWETLTGPYFSRIDDGSMYSNYNNEGYLIHKGFTVDEEVWLSREGVAKGQDDVVKRALEWMDSLSYAYDVTVSKDTVQNPADSIHITAQIKNPGQHALVVSAIVTTAQGSVADSVVLTKALADSLWGAYIKAPRANGRYNINVRTNDAAAGTYRRLPNVAWFAAMYTDDVHGLAEVLPKEFGLQQNYPNPFNPKTVVSCQLPVASKVRLAVYDLLGREVVVLIDAQKAPGKYQVEFDGGKLSSGVYIYRLTAGNFVECRKMLLAR
jgi:hypothetical protein